MNVEKCVKAKVWDCIKSQVLSTYFPALTWSIVSKWPRFLYTVNLKLKRKYIQETNHLRKMGWQPYLSPRKPVPRPSMEATIMLKLDDRNTRLRLWSWTLSSTYIINTIFLKHPWSHSLFPLQYNHVFQCTCRARGWDYYMVYTYTSTCCIVNYIMTHQLAVGTAIDIDKNRILVLWVEARRKHHLAIEGGTLWRMRERDRERKRISQIILMRQQACLCFLHPHHCPLAQQNSAQ